MRAALVLILLAGKIVAQPQSQPVAPQTEQHVEKLIELLQPGGDLRELLQEGVRGDGVHHPWMDDMRRVGVKKALVLVNFSWKGQAADIKPDRILYFDEYDSDCSQITDVERLTKIIASGLGKKLEEFVAEQTARTPWYHLEHMPQAKRGVSRMEVFDDEWLPRSSPEFWPSPLPWSSLIAAVTVHDEAQVAATLGSGEISKDELDAMLIMASGKTDSCVVKMLLSAGAEVNHRNKDGLTPLMYAAGAGKIHNVEVLLGAGADRSVKSILGETAISRAQKNGHTEIAQLLKQSAN